MMDWCDTMGSTNPKDDGRVVSLIATFRLLSAVSLSLSLLRQCYVMRNVRTSSAMETYTEPEQWRRTMGE